MGLIAQILGLGRAGREIAEVFTPNKTRLAEWAHQEARSSRDQFAAEFNRDTGWFNQFINGLNRLPRPVLALGTVGLFTYAMVDPTGFSARMAGLQAVPHELWWLLGAVVSFYFGARELHYGRRQSRQQRRSVLSTVPAKTRAQPQSHQDGNAAFDAWRALSD